MRYQRAEALNKFPEDFELENKPLFRLTKRQKYTQLQHRFGTYRSTRELGLLIFWILT